MDKETESTTVPIEVLVTTDVPKSIKEVHVDPSPVLVVITWICGIQEPADTPVLATAVGSSETQALADASVLTTATTCFEVQEPVRASEVATTTGIAETQVSMRTSVLTTATEAPETAVPSETAVKMKSENPKGRKDGKNLFSISMMDIPIN